MPVKTVAGAQLHAPAAHSPRLRRDAGVLAPLNDSHRVHMGGAINQAPFWGVFMIHKEYSVFRSASGPLLMESATGRLLHPKTSVTMGVKLVGRQRRY